MPAPANAASAIGGVTFDVYDSQKMIMWGDDEGKSEALERGCGHDREHDVRRGNRQPHAEDERRDRDECEREPERAPREVHHRLGELQSDPGLPDDADDDPGGSAQAAEMGSAINAPRLRPSRMVRKLTRVRVRSAPVNTTIAHPTAPTSGGE